MPTVVQFMIQIDKRIHASTYRDKNLTSNEAKKSLCVFMLNRVNPHVKKHFKPDNFTVKVTDACLDQDNLENCRKLDEVERSPFDWRGLPIGHGKIESSKFVVELKYSKDIDPRIFIIKDSYNRFLEDYNRVNKGTRECYKIIKLER